MPNGESSRGELTRRRIIDAAYGLFIRQGFHGTTLRQIARESGIGLGSAYNHFANKDEIFEAVFDSYHPYKDLVPALLETREHSPEEFVRQAAYRLMEALNLRPDFLNLMFIELVEFDGKHVKEMYKKYLPPGVELILDGLAKGGKALRPIPPIILARSFIGFMFSYFITEKAFPPGSDAPDAFHNKAIDHFIDIYLHGILEGGRA